MSHTQSLAELFLRELDLERGLSWCPWWQVPPPPHLDGPDHDHPTHPELAAGAAEGEALKIPVWLEKTVLLTTQNWIRKYFLALCFNILDRVSTEIIKCNLQVTFFLWNLYLTFSENYHLKSYAGFLWCLRHKGTNSEGKVLVLRKVQKHTFFPPTSSHLRESVSLSLPQLIVR